LLIAVETQPNATTQERAFWSLEPNQGSISFLLTLGGDPCKLDLEVGAEHLVSLPSLAYLDVVKITAVLLE